MLNFEETLLLSAVMGLSIYLSLPIILRKNTGQIRIKLLNAVAIGILIFLIGDVFLDAAQSLYNGSLYGYGSSPNNDLIFTVSMATGFSMLFFAGHRWKMTLTPTQLALLIALGIGFQNLTEGLLFGSLGVTIGLTGAALVGTSRVHISKLHRGLSNRITFLGIDRRKDWCHGGGLDDRRDSYNTWRSSRLLL